MTREEFETTYYKKMIRVTGKTYPLASGFIGECTAALYDEDPNGDSVIALMAEGWMPGETPEKWLTFKLAKDTLDESLKDFEVIGTIEGKGAAEIMGEMFEAHGLIGKAK